MLYKHLMKPELKSKNTQHIKDITNVNYDQDQVSYLERPPNSAYFGEVRPGGEFELNVLAPLKLVFQEFWIWVCIREKGSYTHIYICKNAHRRSQVLLRYGIMRMLLAALCVCCLAPLRRACQI